ncbi:hypothetical protein NC651_021317 [Populus alba x Populus x berolinensis]|nr:hypothetical protein NC651_021317 [Populus alba x Populus x berolinensis]
MKMVAAGFAAVSNATLDTQYIAIKSSKSMEILGSNPPGKITHEVVRTKLGSRPGLDVGPSLPPAVAKSLKLTKKMHGHLWML